MSTQNKASTPYTQFQNNRPAMDPYNAGYNQPQVVVQPTAQVQAFTVETALPVRWNWSNLVTSVISLCCCQIFGIIATVIAILSYVDHKSKDFDRSRNKRRIAFGFAIAGIVIGSLIIVGFIAFFSVAAIAVGDVANSFLNLGSNGDLSSNNGF